jgi:ABC-2 type transport system ATP-binding protein
MYNPIDLLNGEKMVESIIEMTDVVKKYGDKAAINGLTMAVRKGELFGFLGPNGAGKTTTTRVISTLTDFSEGTVKVAGIDIKKDPRNAKDHMGVIQQAISLDKDLTIRENMMHHAMMHKVPADERKKRIQELSDFIGLDEYLDRMVDSLSGGWKKKAAIVCALVHKPDILFLDEPTVGLDVKARRLLWDLIKKLNEEGTTIFLTSHYIEEIELLCDRVGIIDLGKLIALGTPQELCNKVGSTAVEYRENEETKYKYFTDRDQAKDFVSVLDDHDQIVIRNTNLEDCFVELTGKSVGGR